MLRNLILSFAALTLFAGTGAATTVQDGFEGPWDFPPATFDFDTDGAGFDEDWFVDHVSWVGDNQFQMDSDAEIKTEGEYSQRANSAVNDGAPFPNVSGIRDLYIARLVEGAEPGTEYTVTLDYRYDLNVENPADWSNHIQYTVRGGDQRERDAIADIEDYDGHERPETMRADPSTFGTGGFHTLSYSYTPAEGETSFTFMAIVRFHSPDLEENWLWLDNFVATNEVSVENWSLH